MGIFDLLGDLSSKRSKELGLGGIQSLLGTRRAAQAGAIGDEMMGITNKDSLPGYFNEQTREYVPWYIDLFDGGGLNAAGGQAEQEAAQSMAATGAMPGGAPMAQPGLLQTGLGSQLSDMERANRNRAAQMAPSLGSRFSDMEMANRNRASQITPGLGSQLSDMEMANRNRASQMTPGLGSQPSNMKSARLDEAKRRFEADRVSNTMSNIYDPRLKMESTGYGRSPYILENYIRKTDLGAGGYGAMGQTMQPPMMQHPEFPQFVDIMKRAGNESVLQNPEQASFVFNNYLKQIGYK